MTVRAEGRIAAGRSEIGLVADGRAFAVGSAATFALKAIFVKLAYAAHPIDPLSLLALRMGIALPFFLWLASRERGAAAEPLTARLWGGVMLVGFVGYYLSSLFDLGAALLCQRLSY